MAHHDFPELTHQAKCVLMSTLKGIDVSRPYWDRRFAAAVIREVVKQAAPLSVGPGSMQVVRVADLLDIADNLHSPPPPTREEMDAALQSLADQIKDLTGCFDVRLEVVKAGIAHHCKVQP